MSRYPNSLDTEYRVLSFLSLLLSLYQCTRHICSSSSPQSHVSELLIEKSFIYDKAQHQPKQKYGDQCCQHSKYYFPFACGISVSVHLLRDNKKVLQKGPKKIFLFLCSSLIKLYDLPVIRSLFPATQVLSKFPFWIPIFQGWIVVSFAIHICKLLTDNLHFGNHFLKHFRRKVL